MLRYSTVIFEIINNNNVGYICATKNTILNKICILILYFINVHQVKSCPWVVYSDNMLPVLTK